MNELQKTLDEAFRLFGAIAVSGESVDVMAAARDRLRRAYQQAGEWMPPAEKEQAHGG